MSDTLNDVIVRAGELLRADGKETMAHSLKELANDAFDAVKLYFQARGVNNIVSQQDITVNAGVTSITATSHSALFAVMQRPFALFEKPTGSTYWVPMRLLTSHVPFNHTAQAFFGQWAWEENTIKVPEATVAISVRVRYMGYTAALSLPTSTIAWPDLVSPLAHIVASRAQGGNEYHEATANKLLELISRADEKIDQQRPVRRFRRIFGIPL